MQVRPISNYTFTSTMSEKKHSKTPENQEQLASRTTDSKGAKAMRNMMMALLMMGAAGGAASCDDGIYTHAEAHATVSGDSTKYWHSTLDSLKCHCKHDTDTIIKWYYNYQKPIPLDSLYNNMQNWDIDGTDDDKNDPNSKRNIIHYEGTREWEYGSREIGDMNILESSRNILIYDTEIKDYKGNHESYGKRILRIPSTNFSIVTKDGDTIRSPKGLFVEEYASPEKGASVLDCELKTRAFVQTNGDTLNVARKGDSNVFVETGKVAKGYLGANSILLKNLIGRYDTEDHYVDFKLDLITDDKLRCKYVELMDNKED